MQRLQAPNKNGFSKGSTSSTGWGMRGEARIVLCMVHYTQTEGNDKQNVQGGKEENQYFPLE